VKEEKLSAYHHQPFLFLPQLFPCGGDKTRFSNGDNIHGVQLIAHNYLQGLVLDNSKDIRLVDTRLRCVHVFLHKLCKIKNELTLKSQLFSVALRFSINQEVV
jgi:hypothetical protein